jgi:hypothetical protein
VCNKFKQGDTCDELTPLAMAAFAIHCLCYIVGVGALAYGAWLVRLSVAQFGGINKFGNALQTTLACAQLGILGTVLQLTYETNHVFTGARYHNVLDVYKAWYAIATTIMFVFTTIAMLNVSLLWIEVVQRAKKGKAAKASNVKRYKVVLFVYYPIIGGKRLVFVGFKLMEVEVDRSIGYLTIPGKNF